MGSVVEESVHDVCDIEDSSTCYITLWIAHSWISLACIASAAVFLSRCWSLYFILFSWAYYPWWVILRSFMNCSTVRIHHSVYFSIKTIVDQQSKPHGVTRYRVEYSSFGTCHVTTSSRSGRVPPRTTTCTSNGSQLRTNDKAAKSDEPVPAKSSTTTTRFFRKRSGSGNSVVITLLTDFCVLNVDIFACQIDGSPRLRFVCSPFWRQIFMYWTSAEGNLLYLRAFAMKAPPDFRPKITSTSLTFTCRGIADCSSSHARAHVSRETIRRPSVEKFFVRRTFSSYLSSMSPSIRRLRKNGNNWSSNQVGNGSTMTLSCISWYVWFSNSCSVVWIGLGLIFRW